MVEGVGFVGGVVGECCEDLGYGWFCGGGREGGVG